MKGLKTHAYRHFVGRGLELRPAEGPASVEPDRELVLVVPGPINVHAVVVVRVARAVHQPVERPVELHGDLHVVAEAVGSHVWKIESLEWFPHGRNFIGI